MLAGRDAAAQAALLATSRFAEPDLQTALTELAGQHGLLGLVLLRLEQSGGAARLPADLTRQYGERLRLLRRQAALWDLERDYLLGLLGQAGIPTLPLKGAALRLTAYHDSVERPFGDLDVLVPERSVDRAAELLGEAGYRGESESRARQYREQHHHLILRKDMGFVVELHWALEPPGSPFLLDPAAFLRSARTLTTPLGPVQVPAAEHSVLHLSTQNAEDGFSRLGRIVDLDRVITGAGAGFDWDSLTSEALSMRVNGVVALSLRLAELLFGTAVPAGYLERLQLDRRVRAQLATLDPVGVLLEQRVLRRPSLHRLLLLWSIPDSNTRSRVRRALSAGAHDWYQPGRSSRTSRRLATLKLWVYELMLRARAQATPRSKAGRLRRFWGNGQVEKG